MVVRILNSSSEKYDLPWHRIVNRNGQISLPRGNGYELQKELLEKEGVVFGSEDTIDLRKYLWQE
jgi:methylated-DNA-protein-cysteine methyltransferase-like protein